MPKAQSVFDEIQALIAAKEGRPAPSSRPTWKGDPSKSVHDDMNDWLVSRGEQPMLPQLQINTDDDPPGFPSNTPANYARLRQAQEQAATEGLPLLLDRNFRLIRPARRLE